MDRFTRRHVLRLGAGTAALAALPLPARALAACDVPMFELPLADAEGAVAAGGWRTLPAVRAPRRFDLVGLRWGRARHVHAQVRARRRGGAWTPWTELHGHAGHAPDGARRLEGTEPCWTGEADWVQVRLRGDVDALRARFVHAGPAARSAGRRARTARRTSRAAQPPIIMRSQWGGDQCPPRAPAEYGSVQLAFVHHTASANDYRPEDSAAIVLGICRYHRNTNGWNDLGYNFLVDKYGQIFEGRAGGIDQPVIGAQAQGYNAQSTGIACIGDFRAVTQSEPGFDALARLIGWKLSVHGVPVQGEVTVTSAGGESNRYPAGTPVTLQRVSGHRDGDRTTCPGDALYAQLPALRERAAGYAQPVSKLTVRADATRVRHPGPVQLAGELTFGDGASSSGALVDVQYQTAGGAWTNILRTSAGPDGTWRAAVEIPSSGLLRARYPGDGGRPPIEAAAVRVRVLPRLTLDLARRRTRRGRRVPFEGTLGPTWPSRVTVIFEVRVRGRWVRVQRKRINVRGGRFRSYVRPGGRGLYRVSVVAPGARVRRRLRAT